MGSALANEAEAKRESRQIELVEMMDADMFNPYLQTYPIAMERAAINPAMVSSARNVAAVPAGSATDQQPEEQRYPYGGLGYGGWGPRPYGRPWGPYGRPWGPYYPYRPWGPY